MTPEQAIVNTRLTGAFPNAIRPTVERALAVLPEAKHSVSEHDIGRIGIHGEEIKIPARIHSPETPPAAFAGLDDTERLILSCLYTRHNDGYIRQKHVEKLLASPHEWVAPFVIQLTGEYVIEILRAIESNLPLLTNERYARFAIENSAYITLTKAHMISYWNTYYRFEYPHFTDYPGYKIMQAFSPWKRREAPRTYRPRPGSK